MSEIGTSCCNAKNGTMAECGAFLGVRLPLHLTLPVNAFVKLLDKKEMEKLMLERPPFFFIEKAVVITDTENEMIAVWAVASMSEERSAGHFPQKPIVPLIELCKAMAQTGIIVTAVKGDEGGRVPIAIGSGDSKAIARDLIPAPATILIEAKLTKIPLALRLKSIFAGKSVRRFLERVHFVDAIAYRDGEPIGSLVRIQYVLLPRKLILR